MTQNPRQSQQHYYPSMNNTSSNYTNNEKKNGGKESVLSYILPVHEATKILGKETVQCIVHAMKHFYLHSSNDNGASNNNSNISSSCTNNHHSHYEPSFRIETRPTPSSEDEEDEEEELIPSAPVMGIDKAGAVRTLLPPPVTPHVGAGGHLALIECIFYALARHQVKSIILLQDFIIFLAICQCADTEKLALLSFRIYDGFQKRKMITRDTLHRFLSDVHGEECHKRQNVKQILDQMFAPLHNKTGQNPSKNNNDAAIISGMSHHVPLTHLSESQYVLGIDATVKKDNGSHILLDWLVILGKNMLPKNGYCQPLSNSMQKLLKRKMEYVDVIYPDGSIRALCQRYGLLMMEHDDLYETKRRYRSIVDQDNAPIIDAGNKNNSNSNNESEGEEDDSHHLPMDESEGQPKSTNSSNKMNNDKNASNNKMKNVITETAFLNAVSSTNEEFGHGGYLTQSLAQLIFIGGLKMRRTRQKQQHYWTMFDALSFGLGAVRGESLLNGKAQHARGKDAEIPLLKFLYQAFLQLPKYSEENIPDVITTTKEDVNETLLMEHLDDSSDEKENAKMMTRTQIAHMLLLLIEQLSYRLKSDSPEEDTSANFPTEKPYSFTVWNGTLTTTATLCEETTMVEVSFASLLGLLPPGQKNGHRSKATTVSLKSLVDYVLAHSSSSKHMGNDEGMELFSFQDFVNWYYAPPDYGGILSLIQRRIGPVLLELRLIASIVFGIQPTLPSLERTLVTEVERRHKCRYPQTDFSKRGPMGTTWYVIQSLWFKKWCAYAEITSLDTSKQLKSVGVINNNALLMDDGSLALRPGLRWKTDFEVSEYFSTLQ